MTPPRYVITGGPCAGKTTTLDELGRRGHFILAEGARLEIEEGLARGQSLDEIRSGDWLERVVRRQFAMEQALPPDTACFLDRGVPDSVAYYEFLGVPEEEVLKNAVSKSSYRKVFILALVSFEQDHARNESADEARKIESLLRKAYQELGYDIVDVPVMSVGERADFILSNM